MVKRSGSFLVGLMAGFILVQPATAAWTYDSGAGTISDGNWTLRVNRLSDGNYSLGLSRSAGQRAYISGTGDLDLRGLETDTGLTLSEFTEYALWQCTVLTSILMPDTVLALHNNVLDGCTALTNVVLSANLQKIGSGAFNGCRALASVTPLLPDTLTSLGDRAFINCRLEGALTLRNPEIQSIEMNTFYQCSGIPSAELPYVTAIGKNAFQNCTSLTNVVLNAQVHTIESNGFGGCGALATFSPTNLEALTDLGDRVFSTCRSLGGDFSMPLVTEVKENAFYNCSYITSVEMPNVVSLGPSVFKNCGNLKRVVLGNQSQSIGKECFSSPSISSITPFLPSSLTEIGQSAFYNCSSITCDLELLNPALTNFPEQCFYRVKSPKITLPRYASVFGKDSFTQMTPGVEIYFLGEAPVSYATQSFSTTDGKNPCVIYACRPMDRDGWDAVTTELTESDLASDAYPGPATFGLMVDGSARNWLVYWKSPFASGPFVIRIL